MSFGAKSSRPGKSVLGTDPRDQSAWTDFQAIMRIQTSGNGSRAIGGTPGVTTVTVNHNLGYAPFFLVFVRWTIPSPPFTPWIEQATWGSYEPFYGQQVEFQPKVTANTLVLKWLQYGGASDVTCDYWYLIGRDPAT